MREAIIRSESGVPGGRELAGGRAPWMAGAPLPTDIFARLRRCALLQHCKWDPQVNDASTLANFPLILRAETWRALKNAAEGLTAEALAAEQELVHRPDLLKRIGLPRAIRRALSEASSLGLTRSAVRVMRFDFHLTAEGWRISEVNSDVPGGFTEASSFTQMVAANYAGAAPAGDPAADWCRAVAEAAGPNGVICLLTAPGFMEDHQIMAYLGSRLTALGCKSHLASPLQLEWREGLAFLNSACHQGPMDAVVRFYQGEWLAELPVSCGWPHFFRGGKTPVGNPGYAIIPESKRFPLAWDQMDTPLNQWRRWLPETRDPRDAPWETDESWLLKSTFCNTDDTVSIRSAMEVGEWEIVAREVRRRPEAWVAQRRFQPVTLMTAMGQMYPCLGIYTIDGKAAGVYARMAPQPVIDFAAMDVAVLVESE
ncbi:MAG: hypothetical protein JWR69_3285 [Pedosphaera sp.]|nr:hypothetical protein [Pedosphaera sp.]